MSDSIDEANLKKYYEFTKHYPTTMYDNVPYVRDYNICNQDKICLTSGNLVKYTQVNINQKTYKITTD